MSPKSSGSMGLDNVNGPDDQASPRDDARDDGAWDEDARDDDDPWEGDEPGPDDEAWPGDRHWPEAGGSPGSGGGPAGHELGGSQGARQAPGQAGLLRGRRPRPLVLAAVGLLAAAVGAAATLALMRTPSSSPSAAPGGSPSFAAPGQAPGGGFPGRGGFPGGGGALHMFIGGKVAAVSATSITISGGSHTIKAAITGSTTVSGHVSNVGSIKVGDLVSAQIAESGGKATATAIQDPAELPSGGGGANLP